LRPFETRSGRRETEVRLPKAADVVDLGIAHDGYPPTVAANASKRAVADGKAGSAPRKIENLRLVASGMDRLIVTMEAEAIPELCPHRTCRRPIRGEAPSDLIELRATSELRVKGSDKGAAEMRSGENHNIW